MTLPLAGVRILDISRVLAGPLTSMILADLGADVIKIERPGTGDDTRGWGPPFDERGESAYFLAVNRNKLSVAADFDAPADREFLHALIGGADVVLDNFREGALERRGFGPDEMIAKHPRLIWCSITGFGLGNPRPGYDFVVQAESGWMAITGAPGGAPTKIGVAVVDVLAGKDAAIAILAALAGDRRGERRLSVSLSHSAISALVNITQNALVTGVESPRCGNAHPTLVPYDLFETADRPIVIAVGNDKQFVQCTKALELDELAADVTLATNAGRFAARPRVVGAIAAKVRTRPSAHWVELLARVGVPCGPVRPVLEALEDFAASPLTGVAPLAPATIWRPPPLLDEHGALVRAEGWAAFVRARA